MAKKKTTKKSAQKATKKKKVPPKKSPDVPATQAMIYELREEMKNSMSSLESKMEARFNKIDGRFNEVDSNIKKVVAELHRVALVVEEQNARNKYVLDGYTSLNDRVERLEKKVFDENM